MLASIFVEAWDFNSIGFVLVFLRDQFHPSALMLGLAAGGFQAGMALGALVGGWLTDKFGRRLMFMTSIALFVVLALAQAFAPDLATLLIIRVLLGFPLGADITTGYTYIMEYLPKGQREIWGNRWQVIFAVGQVACSAVVALFIVCGMSHELIWRLVLGLGALPAVIIFVLRKDLPETAIWLIRQGRFCEAKAASLEMYNDSLDMLPDTDVHVTRPPVTEFLADLRSDPIRWRATLYSWIAFVCCAGEFSTFGFYIPVIFMMVGVSGIAGTTLTAGLIWIVAGIAGWVAPAFTPKLGHRGVGIFGFGTVIVGLGMAAVALYTNHPYVLPLAAAIAMWGHTTAVTNPLTIATVVSKARYRGTAGGFSYFINKAPLFVGIFLFPSLFAAVGQANATALVILFPLIGLLAAIFVFREMYGIQSD
ncbi:MAG: MFS transporter [Rhodopila sp.]|nr:MFS transporter [Rhodopila sp.]